MSDALRNIPPLWNAVAHWLACMLYLSRLPKRLGGWRLAAAGAAFLPALVLLLWYPASWSGAAFNLAMAVFAGFTLLPFLALARVSAQKSVYYCARAFIFGGFTASLAWQMYMFATYAYHLPDTWWAEALMVLGLYAVALLVMGWLEHSHPTPPEELYINATTCGVTVATAVTIYIVSSLSYTNLLTPFGSNDPLQAFNIRTIVYLCGVAILYASHQQLCESHSRQEVAALQNMLNMQYANYRAGQESVDLINRKYHDLKHQIAVLRSEIGTEKKLEYLDRMEKDIRAYEAENKTGNQVLDTILTSKSLYCQRQDIKLTCVADGAVLAFMDVMDLSTLFGNALDNAIESVSRLPDAEQRLIHLSVARQKGFVRIRVENRCDAALHIEGGKLPKTTKQDAKNHGYGLKSILQVAQKYNGSATVQADKGWFELRVLLPAGKEK